MISITTFLISDFTVFERIVAFTETNLQVLILGSMEEASESFFHGSYKVMGACRTLLIVKRW